MVWALTNTFTVSRLKSNKLQERLILHPWFHTNELINLFAAGPVPEQKWTQENGKENVLKGSQVVQQLAFGAGKVNSTNNKKASDRP